MAVVTSNANRDPSAPAAAFPSRATISSVTSTLLLDQTALFGSSLRSTRATEGHWRLLLRMALVRTQMHQGLRWQRWPAGRALIGRCDLARRPNPLALLE